MAQRRRVTAVDLVGINAKAIADHMTQHSAGKSRSLRHSICIIAADQKGDSACAAARATQTVKSIWPGFFTPVRNLSYMDTHCWTTA